MFDDFQPELLYRNFVKYSSPEGRDELAQQCRAKVVEWRWASDDMAFAFRQPFVKERYRCDPKWLKEGAKLKPDSKRHGLDAEGLIHVVENMNSNAGSDQTQISAKYVTYKDNLSEAVRYLAPCSLQTVQRRIYDGPRIIREHNFIYSNGSERHFEWRDERLHRILSMGWRHDSVGPASKQFSGFDANSHTEQIFEYDELGRLDRIVERSLNHDGTIYEVAVKNDYSSAKKALRKAAKALNEPDWTKLLDVTPDFIVAAVDNTLEFDFATDIKAVVPAAKFKALKANGLI